MAIIAFCLFAALAMAVQARHPIDLFHQTEHFEGDIVVDASNRNAIGKTQKWTGGIIPYAFDDYWSDGYRRLAEKAMKEIMDHTCLKFVPRKDEKNYLQIINHSGCWSNVGMQGGQQQLSLKESAWGSCWIHGTVVHELLHAVGLWHEQSRPDRDEYVTIRFENIPKHLQYNFEKRDRNRSHTYDVPYNYLSVMHYDSYAFSNNGKITIETKDKSMQERLGHRDHAVETDYEKIRRIYDCEGKYPKMPNPTLPPPTAPPPCVDNVDYCKEYLDQCTQEWTKSSCRKTCKHCSGSGGSPSVTTTVAPLAPCKDDVDYCHQYAKQCKTELWMNDYCRKTCRLC